MLSYSIIERCPLFGGYKCINTIGKQLFGAPNLVLYSEGVLYSECPLTVYSHIYVHTTKSMLIGGGDRFTMNYTEKK